MMSSRIVFLLGTLIALAGNADATATSCTGASGTFNTITNPSSASAADQCKCATGYAARDGTTTTGTVSLDCTKCIAGYYLSSADGTTVNAVCTAAPANKYWAGLKDIRSAAGTAVETPTSCPFSGTSAAGSDALADCTPDCAATDTSSNAVASGGTCYCATTKFGSPVDSTGGTALFATTGCDGACSSGALTAYSASVASTNALADCKVILGKYLKTASDATGSAGGSLDIAACPADHYCSGGTAQDSRNVDAVTVHDANTVYPVVGKHTRCPFAGNTGSATGKSSLSDCVVSCTDASNAAATGTCVCAAGFFGAPSKAVSGAQKQETTNPDAGCSACPTNTESAYTAANTPALAGGTFADCKVKPGYYISTKSNSATVAKNRFDRYVLAKRQSQSHDRTRFEMMLS